MDDRKMVRYRACRQPETNCAAGAQNSNERRSFGYRRPFILLRREGEPSGINRIYRLYREEGLTVRKAKGTTLGGWNTRSDPGRGATECAMVTGLRARPVRLRPPL